VVAAFVRRLMVDHRQTDRRRTTWRGNNVASRRAVIKLWSCCVVDLRRYMLSSYSEDDIGPQYGNEETETSLTDYSRDSYELAGRCKPGFTRLGGKCKGEMSLLMVRE